MSSARAILLLDPKGLVLEAGPSAEQMLGRKAAGVVGMRFVQLFEFEVSSRDPETLQAQWEALEASAQAASLPLMLLSEAGQPEREILVSLSPAGGSSSRWFASLEEKPAAAAVAPAASQSSTGLAELLGADSPVGAVELRPAEIRCVISRSWKQRLGYTDRELPDNSNDSWTRLVHPEDAAFLSASPKVSQRAIDVEIRLQHRSGAWVWTHCIGSADWDEQGGLLRFSALLVDITERKHMEEAAQSRADRLQSLTDEGPMAAFQVLFSPREELWISPALKRLLRHDPARLADSPENLQHLLPEECQAMGLRSWLSSLGKPGASQATVPALLADRESSRVHTMLFCQRRFSAQGELIAATGCVIPLQSSVLPDESVPLAEALKAPLLATLSETQAEAVLLADAQGMIRFANASALRLLEVSAERVLGKPAAEVFRLADIESGKLLKEDVCELALQAQTPLPINTQTALLSLAEADAAIPIAWTVRSSYAASGAFQGSVILFRDPDELTLTPDELVKANRSEALSLLAGGIAHDFNNLLTTILGGISLAKDAKNPAGLEDGEKACLAAKGLTRQLLSFAKGGGGVRTVVPSLDILHDSVKIAAAGSTTLVVVEAQGEFPPVQVDRSQILQVFQNLIVNALQAMPPAPHRGRVSLGLAVVEIKDNEFPPLPAGDYLRFDVRDNGKGIPPENLERIWDPFFTTKKHGTGLGLATVLSIVRKHGGQIGVVSEVGVGTVFTLLLPVAKDPVETQMRRAPTLRFGTGRVLFMDDDPKICTLAAGMLESLEYKVDIARNGEEALKLYRSYLNINRPYDLVLMDLTVIGGMGGEEAFMRMKEMDPDVRAVACSGYDNEEIAHRFLSLGFCGYLPKPFRVADLAKAIKAVIG